MHGTPVTVAAAYPQSTLNGTLTRSSLSGTALYETYVAGWKNLHGCVIVKISLKGHRFVVRK